MLTTTYTRKKRRDLLKIHESELKNIQKIIFLHFRNVFCCFLLIFAVAFKRKKICNVRIRRRRKRGKAKKNSGKIPTVSVSLSCAALWSNEAGCYFIFSAYWIVIDIKVCCSATSSMTIKALQNQNICAPHHVDRRQFWDENKKSLRRLNLNAIWKEFNACNNVWEM